jgi:hypothetical protein
LKSFSAAYRLAVLISSLAIAARHGWKSIVLGAWIGAAACAAAAQTQVGGVIGSDTVWRASQGPFIVGSDLQVQAGKTLIIEPGTTVYMESNTRFLVSGTLKAEGTAQTPIVITSVKRRLAQPASPGDWQQLIFNAGSSASALRYVDIEYGKGVLVNSAAPSFNFVTLRAHQGAAMGIDLAASPVGVGNKAVDNNINAIVVPDGDLSGSVTWGLRGIPYLVLTGTVGVGAAPRVTGMTPATIQQGESLPVTLTGTRLAGLARVRFTLAGITAQVLDATDVQARLQLSAANEAALGVATLEALAHAGELTFSNALTVVASQPKLASVEPGVIFSEYGSVTLTLKGSNFAADSVVYLDQVALQTTFVNSTELRAVVENQSVNGARSLTLRTPKGNGSMEVFTSNPVALAVVATLPVVTSVTPDALRRGETKRIQISGAALGGTELSTAAAGLLISNVALSPTLAAFDLSASAGANLGVQQIKIRNGAGQAMANVTVNAGLPQASVAPSPLAVPPDGSARQFALQLSFADTEPHSFAVSTLDPTVAATATPNLTIPAGQTQVIGSMSGIKNGTTALRLVSPTLGTLTVPLYVTADFIGLNTTASPHVGVVVAKAPVSPPALSVPLVSASIGVVHGAAIERVSPQSLVVGSGPLTLTASGSGLHDAVSVAFVPDTGLTVHNFSAAPDGGTLTVSLSVAADAPVTPRRLVVTNAGGKPYPAIQPGADRILVTLPVPEVSSITPLVVTPATGSTTMLVRGRRLQSAQALSLTPPGGIRFGSTIDVNADGTELRVGMEVEPGVALGQRVLRVTTPAGPSDAAATQANTLNVVATSAGNVTPLVAPSVGVVLAGAPPAPPQTGLFTRPVGVAFGRAAVALSPRARMVGDSFTLTVTGIGLEGVTSASLVPSTGVELGTPVPSGDGRSLAIAVTIAADAPKTARALRLLAGAVPVVFTTPAGAQFAVTGMVPTLESVGPLLIQAGAAPVAMTIRGRNLRDLQSVSFVPPDGISVFTPEVIDAEATEVRLNVQAAANAPLGPRAVVVTTLAGATAAELSVANTVTVSANAPPLWLMTGPAVGVVKQVPPPPVPALTLHSRHVGVQVAQDVQPQAPQQGVFAAPVGVTLGSYGVRITPQDWAVGGAGSLTLSGKELTGVTSATVTPSAGVAVGPLEVAPDGTQVLLPLQVAADAVQGARRITFLRGSTPLPFAVAGGDALRLYPAGVPTFASISPIVAAVGTQLTLTIVGQNLKHTLAVTASPADGLQFDNQVVVNAAGTEASVRVQVAPGATLGKRVIQVLTPTAVSSGVAGPSNSFTVYGP